LKNKHIYVIILRGNFSKCQIAFEAKPCASYGS
jgi:hypothetical protein